MSLQVPLLVRVVHDEKGACSTSSWESEGLMARQRRRDSRRLAKQGATGSASRRRGSSSGSSSSGGSYSEASHVGCVGLASSQQRLAAVLGAADRALDDLAVKELGGGDRCAPGVTWRGVFVRLVSR